MSKFPVATLWRKAVRSVSMISVLAVLASTALMAALVTAQSDGDQAIGRARYAIVLGKMHNESGFAGPDLANVLTTSLQRELSTLRRVALVSADDEQTLAQAKQLGLPMLRLEGNVVQIMREREGEQVSVHCEIALMLMNQTERNLHTVLKGAATGIEASMGPAAPQEKRLARKAVDGAVRSALRNASSAIENAAARADVQSSDTATASLPRKR